MGAIHGGEGVLAPAVGRDYGVCMMAVVVSWRGLCPLVRECLRLPDGTVGWRTSRHWPWEAVLRTTRLTDVGLWDDDGYWDGGGCVAVIVALRIMHFTRGDWW